MSTVTQRQSVFYTGTFALLRFVISQLAGEVALIEDREGAEKRVSGGSFRIFYFLSKSYNLEINVGL
jgi:hypothetical protein